MPKIFGNFCGRKFCHYLFWINVQNDAKTSLYKSNFKKHGSYMAGSKFLESLIAGSSEKMKEVRRHIELAAPYPVNVLAVGPTGSGKELIARGIHKLSGRGGKFVAVNSAAIPAELLEAELFGYEKGSFTGADKGRKGKVEEAAGGTLFLDEIGDMPFSLQAKLLRVLETKTVQKIGSEKSLPVDFRLVCATHADIGSLARRGKFRADLLYRIAVYTIENPPLSERTEDIEDLIKVLSIKLKKTEKKITPVKFDTETIEFLCSYDWPGNIRELANFLQKCSVLYSGKLLTIQQVRPLMPNFTNALSESEQQATLWDAAEATDDQQLSMVSVTSFENKENLFSEYSKIFEKKQPINLKELLQNIEGTLIKAALRESKGSIEQAASRLGVDVQVLRDKMKDISIFEPN